MLEVYDDGCWRVPPLGCDRIEDVTVKKQKDLFLGVSSADHRRLNLHLTSRNVHVSSSHFFSSLPLLTCGGQVCFVSFAPCKTMFNASDGWRHPTGGFKFSADLAHRQRIGPGEVHHKPELARAGRWRQPPGGRVSVPPEVAAQAARKRVEGIEAALGALAAVGTVDGPEVQMLKGVPCQGQAFSSGVSGGPTDQPHGVFLGEGQEAIDSRTMQPASIL